MSDINIASSNVELEVKFKTSDGDWQYNSLNSNAGKTIHFKITVKVHQKLHNYWTYMLGVDLPKVRIENRNYKVLPHNNA